MVTAPVGSGAIGLAGEVDRLAGRDMRARKALVLTAVAAGVLLTPGVASAHPVGVPGTPSCFGERISHGSQSASIGGHALTPKERAAGLQALVDSGFPEAVELFGDTVTVREMIAFVRANYSDDPIVP